MSTHTADGSTAPQTSLGPFSSPGASPTPWQATEWALRRIQKFQLCTVRRDGRPHVTPLLAIWALGAMWFTTGDNEQKAKNLSANQHCALTTGTDTLTGMDYIIEGTASLVTDQATRKTWRPRSNRPMAGSSPARTEPGINWATPFGPGMSSSTGSSRTRGSPSPSVASRPRLATDGAESTAPGCRYGSV